MSNLSLMIYNSVIKAKSKLGTLVLNARLKRSNSTNYNPSTGVKSTSFTESDIDVVQDKFSSDEVDEVQVKSTDIKLIMFNVNGIEPRQDDKVIVGDIEYELKRVTPIQAGEKVVVYTLQLRS